MTKLSSLQVRHPPLLRNRSGVQWRLNRKLLHESDSYRLLSQHFVNSCVYTSKLKTFRYILETEHQATTCTLGGVHILSVHTPADNWPKK